MFSKIVLFIFTISISLTSFGHGGRLDKHGCHHDKQRNRYHCHGPRNNDRKKVESATREVVREGRAFSYVYDRDDWKHWSDFDKDCMNTRHEVLKDQSRKGSIKISPDGCYVSRGEWLDPFSGKRFIKASDLDVDHIVPLKWAHTHGGANWPKSKKEQFANDPENLIAVDDGLNQQKGARGPTEWMPPNHGYRCDYLDRWRIVLDKYGALKMTNSEKRVFDRQLESCTP